MINYKMYRSYKILLTIIILSWTVFIILSVLMILQDKADNLLYYLGILGISEFILLFLTGIYGLLLKKKAVDDTDNSYDETFVKLARMAAESPDRINKNIRRLNYFGNLYASILIIIILLTILGLIMIGIRTGRTMGGFGTVMFALLGVLYIIFRSIYIKFELPEGLTADEKSNPELFRILNSAIHDTKAEHIDKIYITEDANAAVSFLPSGLGFGGKDLLQLGILLLSILDENELKSVIIHELSHIYNKDTKVSSKISCNITRWMRVIERSDNIVANILLIPFAESYINNMNIHLEAISKIQENIADRDAVTFTDIKTYATACMKLELIEIYRNDAYALEEIRSENEPPRSYYSMLLTSFYSEFTIRGREWITQIKKRISSKYDTHPSFTERMQAIGIGDYSYPVKFDFKENNYWKEIQALLADKNHECFEFLSESWAEYTSEFRNQLEIINNYIETDDTDINFEYAMALEEAGKRDKAYRIYETIIAKDADNSPALYRLGQLMLIKNDAAGIEYVKKAADLNSDLITTGLELISEYLMSNGLTNELEMLSAWIKDKSKLADKIVQEVNYIDIKDEFAESDLEQSKVDKIIEILKENSNIKRAYFVKKQLQYSTQNCYVLAVTFHSLLSKRRARASIQAITDKINDLDISCFIMDMNDFPNFYRTFKKVSRSEIYKG